MQKLNALVVKLVDTRT